MTDVEGREREVVLGQREDLGDKSNCGLFRNTRRITNETVSSESGTGLVFLLIM